VVENATSNTIVLSWQPPLIEDQNGDITTYLLRLTTLETGESQEVLTESTNYTLDLVSPNTLYTAVVAAVTSAGRGPFSAAVSVHTLEDGNTVILDSHNNINILSNASFFPSPEPNASPQNLSHTAVNSTSVDLSWSPPPTEHHNGIIRHYIVRVVVEDTGERFTLSTTYQQIAIGSLHPYYVYNFSVSAVTVAPGPYSEPHTVQTLPDGKFICKFCVVLMSQVSPV